MTRLDSTLAHQLNAVLGWMELGNTREARNELGAIPAELQDCEEVLEVRWVLDSEEGDWEDALAAANLLLKVAPENSAGWLHRAYALRRVPGGGLVRAKEALIPALDKFPKEPVIPYNLACYDCQLGDKEKAREWLAEAIRRGSKRKIYDMAIHDPDLEPLWKELRARP